MVVLLLSFRFFDKNSFSFVYFRKSSSHEVNETGGTKCDTDDNPLLWRLHSRNFPFEAGVYRRLIWISNGNSSLSAYKWRLTCACPRPFKVHCCVPDDVGNSSVKRYKINFNHDDGPNVFFPSINDIRAINWKTYKNMFFLPGLQYFW